MCKELSRVAARATGRLYARMGYTTVVEPALPPVVADARSVRQIVLNLLSNALKFMWRGQIEVVLHQEGALTLRVWQSLPHEKVGQSASGQNCSSK